MTSLPDDILDLLTAYALGALEPQEIARVSVLLEERPELRATLAELRATADKLPYALPEASPPDDLRQRVLDHATGRASPATQPTPARLVNRVRVWVWSFGGIAAVAVLAAAIGWAQLVSTRAELEGTRAQLVSTRADLEGTRAQLVRVQREVADAQKLIVALQGTGGSASILQTRGGEAILVAQLPPLQPGRVYQLWRIQGTNSPASAGTFTVDQLGYTTVALPPGKQPQSGEVVAVTNEPNGGSLGPTTDILVKGSSNA
jgi:anti-sigma-K factor RskA